LQNPVIIIASLIGGVMENGIGNVTALYSIDLGFATTKAPLIPAIISFWHFQHSIYYWVTGPINIATKTCIFTLPPCFY